MYKINYLQEVRAQRCSKLRIFTRDILSHLQRLRNQLLMSVKNSTSRTILNAAVLKEYLHLQARYSDYRPSAEISHLIRFRLARVF